MPPTIACQPNTVFQFSNHTPRAFEVRAARRHQADSIMFGPTGMAVGPFITPTVGTTYAPRRTKSTSKPNTDSHTKSIDTAAERVRSDSVVAPAPLEIPRSPDIPTTEPDNKMMTQTNLLVLPSSNPSYQMAYFLKTTGPLAENQAQEIKAKRVSSMPKSALRMFKSKDRRSSKSLAIAHQRLNDALSSDKLSVDTDTTQEGQLPEHVQQKVSKTGKKYFQIDPITEYSDHLETAPRLSPNIIDSQVSVFISESLDEWVHATDNVRDDTDRGRTQSNRNASEPTIRILSGEDSSPVQPLVSGPPSPIIDYGVEAGQQEQHTCLDRFKRIDSKTPLSSHPLSSMQTRYEKPEKPISILPKSNTAAIRPNFKIMHPSPRRLVSHPILKRASSDGCAIQCSRMTDYELHRTASVSPGPPPPRSPLRLKSYPESIASLLNQTSDKLEVEQESRNADESVHSVAESPVIKTIAYDQLTNLTAFPRPDSNSALSSTSSDALSPALGRRWNLQERRQHNKHKPIQTVDSLVGKADSSPKPQRRKLRRARPQDQQPRPLDLSRIRIQTSVRQEEQRLTDLSRTSSLYKPVVSQIRHEFDTPVKHTASPHSQTRANVARKQVSVSVKGRRSPAPRPRSARMPPPRGPRGPPQTPSRSRSPGKRRPSVEVVDTLSAPPRRELPPTPKREGILHRPPVPMQSEDSVATGASFCRTTIAVGAAVTAAGVGSIQPSPTKALPTLPPLVALNTHFPSPPLSAKSAVLSRSRTSAGTASSSVTGGSTHTTTGGNGSGKAGLEARLELLERQSRRLERQNTLLEAALEAVLKTNGSLNGCPCHGNVDSGQAGHSASAGEFQHRNLGMTMEEGKSKRRSGGSSGRASSGSSGVDGTGALGMYLSTRGRKAV